MYISQHITGVQPRRSYFRGIYVVLHINDVITFVCTTSYLFPSPPVSCFKLNFHLILLFKWHFNPPLSPWWKGISERMVRLVKDVLKRYYYAQNCLWRTYDSFTWNRIKFKQSTVNLYLRNWRGEEEHTHLKDNIITGII